MSLKLFGKNAIIYSIGTVGLRASGFLLIPIYTHFLPLKDYGLLATLLLTINFMVTIMDFGLRAGLNRFISEYDKENTLKYLLGSLVVINILCGIIVTIISISFLKPIFVSVLHTSDVTDYILLTCFAAVAQSLSINVMSYFRARNLGMKYMVMNLSVAGVLILSNLILFILLDGGIQGALLAYIIAYGAVGIFAALKIFPKTGFGISKDILLRLFKYSGPLIFATGGFSVMETTAAYFLSYFTSLEQVGIYNLAYRLAQIGTMVIISPFQLAYEPYLFSNLHKPNIKEIVSKLTTYVVLAFTFVAFFIVFIFRDFISVISPEEYFPAYFIVFLLLPANLFSGLFYIGQSLNHVKNKTHVTGSTVALFSLLSVGLNYFLIGAWGLTGLILVYNVIWISIALLMMKSGLKVFPVNLEKKRLSIVALTFVVLLSLNYFAHNIPDYLYYTLIPLLFIIILLIFYYGGFFHEQEKSFINNFFKNFRLKNYKVKRLKY